MTERILLTPKATFLADKKLAASHSDTMASPLFKAAAAYALLHYQMKISGNDPQVLALAMSKLRGAQEYLAELMNLGLPEAPRADMPDSSLVPITAASLDRPYQPPQR